MKSAVSPQMRGIVLEQLAEIEKQENVRILLAVESGSRAWGFHSPDSDYDVRFIYARPQAWHYQLGKKRDVIERPIDADLDVSGWELSKALELALNSNAVLAEWLQSPITYRRDDEAVTQLTDFTSRVLDRVSVTWHYLSLFKRQSKRLSAPEGGIRFKRWFYMLRPALALRWMRLNYEAMPPMDISHLRQGVSLDAMIDSALNDVLKRKMSSTESKKVDSVPDILSRLILDEIEQATLWIENAQRERPERRWQEASDLNMSLSLRAFK